MVREFLEKWWDRKSKILIGCSGGPDSKMLLYSVLDWGKAEIHVAHVDHGWREESRQEAAELQEEIEGLGLVFHTTRLVPAEKNREEAAREGRLAFFRQLVDQEGFQAVLLAHQRDDLAETALKRVLEGAQLSMLKGMQEISDYEGMAIWRPLLKVRKREIEEFLKKRGLKFFVDATNQDPVYLRARMRTRILPMLSETFGKSVEENLARLAERGAELHDYLERKTKDCVVVEGPQGKGINLNGWERLESRHILRKWVALRREKIEEILDGIEGGIPQWQVTEEILVDRGWIFVSSCKKST
jgi:tRNA(Ile)-lysidine synthase